jgi:hypothetical protein
VRLLTAGNGTDRRSPHGSDSVWVRGHLHWPGATIGPRALDPEQSSNAADTAFPLVPIDRIPPRHAVRVPVPQDTVVSQISSNDQGRNSPLGQSCR